MTPPWVFVLLGLFAFRLTRLASWDEITRRPRAWVCGLSDAAYDTLAAYVDEYEAEGADPWTQHAADLPTRRRFYFAKMIHCAWCMGWWVSLAVSVAWWAWPDGTVRVAVPFALSAVVGLVAKQLDD